MVDVNRVKSEFQRIKNLGFIESDKPFAEKNDGAIGNTFETTAVFNPDLASSRDVLIPEPPPPITSTSNSSIVILEEFKIFKI